MKFKNQQAIYLQIADYLLENILTGDLPPDERIPSTRDMATTVQVNPNTVVRTYSYLQDNGIIYNKRGLGHFVASDAYEKTRVLKRKIFLKEIVPELVKQMRLLEIEFSELENLYHQHANN